MASGATTRRACIDIGSNTTRLLVADTAASGLSAVHEERAFTRIGAELHAAGRIRPAKIAEVSDVVRAQLGRARHLGAADIRVVATAAIRRALNGSELADAIQAICGVEVRVLSGEQEAELAFAGACGTLDHRPDGPLGVVDVGGGSSEIVVGDATRGTLSFAVSLPFGSGDLTAHCLAGDPPSPAELDAARREVDAGVGELDDLPRPAEAVAVGGSATSLRRLAGPVLDDGAFNQALGALLVAPAAEVAGRFALDPERVRLLPAGLLILQGVARQFARPLRVGLGGVREGVLLEAGR